MKANVTVTLKPGILDTQGQAVRHALLSMDGRQITDVRIGKLIEIELDVDDNVAAMKIVTKMCDKLLANPVTEDYNIELLSG